MRARPGLAVVAVAGVDVGLPERVDQIRARRIAGEMQTTGERNSSAGSASEKSSDAENIPRRVGSSANSGATLPRGAGTRRQPRAAERYVRVLTTGERWSRSPPPPCPARRGDAE